MAERPTTEVDLSGFGYERLEHVGKGQYASAALVQDIATGTKYVAKCISLASLNEHDQDLANQEVILLQSLSNPYIVGYKDSFLIEGSNTLVIVMEYCSGGDLRKLIKEKAKSGEYFTEELIMTPPLTPQSAVFIILSRIRRRLVGQRLNWLCAFAPFDSEGAGNLSSDELSRALTSMHLGICEGEVVALVEGLIPTPSTKISLDTFSACVREVPLEVKQCEAWTRHTFASLGVKVGELLSARDGAQVGTLPSDIFRVSLRELVPKFTDRELNLLLLLANKNAMGDIDYVEFVSFFCASPPQFPPRSVIGSPGMPPLSVGAPFAVPSGMPPLSVGAPIPTGMGTTSGTTLNDMSFHSCASRVDGAS